IEWEKFDDPADVSLADLQQAVREVASVALLARHWPAKGTRQDAFLALTGGLQRGGLSVPRVELFVAALAAASNDEEPANRVQAVAASAARLAQDGKATGWPKLERLLGPRGPEVVRRVREWLAIARRTGLAGSPAARKARLLAPYRPFPVEALP